MSYVIASDRVPMSRTEPSIVSRFADRFGATASFLCAVHCALLPLVIAVLPAIGLGFLANHRFERGFITFASALALTTLVVGFRRHHRFRAFWFLVPGILLLIVTGYLANALHVRIGRTIVAALFGIGAALTLDEFALWLNLRDVYWAKQGRRSIDAIMTASSIGGLVVLGLGFWRDVGRAIARLF